MTSQHKYKPILYVCYVNVHVAIRVEVENPQIHMIQMYILHYLRLSSEYNLFRQ